jgi:hypothetical protein
LKVADSLSVNVVMLGLNEAVKVNCLAIVWGVIALVNFSILANNGKGHQ